MTALLDINSVKFCIGALSQSFLHVDAPGGGVGRRCLLLAE